jgi:hypothetical protein
MMISRNERAEIAKQYKLWCKTELCPFPHPLRDGERKRGDVRRRGFLGRGIDEQD